MKINKKKKIKLGNILNTVILKTTTFVWLFDIFNEHYTKIIIEFKDDKKN